MSANQARAAELRASAGDLRRRATDVERMADELRRRVSGMTYAGPAADSLHATTQAHWRRLEATASRVCRLADAFEREADSLPVVEL